MQRVAVFALCLLGACVVDAGDDASFDETSEVSLEATTGVPITTLTNNQDITISGVPRSIRYYKIDVPANYDKVNATRSGDGISTPTHVGADIYMKRGALPSATSYDCRRLDSTSSGCTIDRPLAGTYYIMVYGTTGYTDMTLGARYWNTYSPMPNNASYSLSRPIGVDEQFKLVVPSGTESVTFRMSLDFDQTGEAEVFVKINGFASQTNYDCMFGIGYNYSQGAGTCGFANPIGGTYYVKIVTHRRYYATFSGGYRYPIAPPPVGSTL